MRYIINTANINSVGLKIYYDETLKGEYLIKGSIYPVYFDLDGELPKTLVLETCHEAELHNKVLPERYDGYRNSDVFEYEERGCLIDQQINTRDWQFAYKTEIDIYESNDTNIVLIDFVESTADGQCSAIMVNENCKLNQRYILQIAQKFVRRYDTHKLVKGLVKKVIFNLICIVGIDGLIGLLFYQLNYIDLSGTEFKLAFNSLGLVFFIPFIFPIFMLRNALKEFCSLIKEENIPVQ